METILQVVGGFVLLLIIYGIIKLPDMVADKLKDTRQLSNNKQLQIDNYFRQSSGKSMQDVLSDWVKIINDVDNSVLERPNDLQKLLNRTLVYSSAKTIKLLGMFLQHTYKNGEKKIDDYSQLVYVAMIVSCLKFDFSGEILDPLDLLKVKYHDYLDNEEEFKQHLNNIESELLG
ncbi:hypothetical protein FEFB_13750 [Fructobacillus sp. EFB-N1]|uniref:hypothetical protein n=1 Tax=Fructobacillus sp. EFB-N1 TaxID=1658766 RepID=UPI00064DB47F|nr:hypothetical protein [Fructobacillus sp. EFB-N1]KMK52902.1 hypothetical protein FEFB_13750 [Fructobacillus sp. EFB-N1]